MKQYLVNAELDNSVTLKSPFGWTVDCFDHAVDCILKAYGEIALVRANCQASCPGLVALEACLRNAINAVPAAAPQMWVRPVDSDKEPGDG